MSLGLPELPSGLRRSQTLLNSTRPYLDLSLGNHCSMPHCVMAHIGKIFFEDAPCVVVVLCVGINRCAIFLFTQMYSSFVNRLMDTANHLGIILSSETSVFLVH